MQPLQNPTSFQNIDTVVFDLGGVVIDLRRENAVEALIRLGLKGADEMLDTYCQTGPFLLLETGKLSAGEFFDTIRRACGDSSVSDKQIEDAFNSFLVDLPVERLRALRQLRADGLRVLALSNTNPIMYHSWIARRFRAEGLTVNDYFDGIVTSFQEGVCKPDKLIFERLVARYGLDPARTLFLDDGEANCRAAEQCGLRAAHVTPQDTMLQIISRIERPQ